jgi:hypothetical protein
MAKVLIEADSAHPLVDKLPPALVDPLAAGQILNVNIGQDDAGSTVLAKILEGVFSHYSPSRGNRLVQLPWSLLAFSVSGHR